QCLGPDRPLPRLDALLLGPNIAAVAQPGREGPDEAAALRPDDRDQPGDDPGLDEDVVVNRKDVVSHRLLVQELALLGDAAALGTVVILEGSAARFDDSPERLDDGALPGRRVALVGDDDAQVAVALSGQAGERHDQR